VQTLFQQNSAGLLKDVTYLGLLLEVPMMAIMEAQSLDFMVASLAVMVHEALQLKELLEDPMAWNPLFLCTGNLLEAPPFGAV
jgi:hypothetical protein